MLTIIGFTVVNLKFWFLGAAPAPVSQEAEKVEQAEASEQPTKGSDTDKKDEKPAVDNKVSYFYSW